MGSPQCSHFHLSPLPVCPHYLQAVLLPPETPSIPIQYHHTLSLCSPPCKDKISFYGHHLPGSCEVPPPRQGSCSCSCQLSTTLPHPAGDPAQQPRATHTPGHLILTTPGHPAPPQMLLPRNTARSTYAASCGLSRLPWAFSSKRNSSTIDQIQHPQTHTHTKGHPLPTEPHGGSRPSVKN